MLSSISCAPIGGDGEPAEVDDPILVYHPAKYPDVAWQFFGCITPDQRTGLIAAHRLTPLARRNQPAVCGGPQSARLSLIRLRPNAHWPSGVPSLSAPDIIR